uniref:Uncharacterized protein n=1 Tax=Anas zonorhyncha TaxID=75864 RepID=A0A8B9V2Z7_9AVES
NRTTLLFKEAPQPVPRLWSLPLVLGSCCGSARVGSRAPPQLLSHSPSSKRNGEKICEKCSRVEIRTRKSCNNYCNGQNRLSIRR